ncbi:hypothetical protein GCM10008090_01380 [Arenicella chitinivorans]|uniref:Uncharacterized protein n=1 Tax=Arenicella chitinivorans TaxID=1329800 RepID=A0A918RHA0_9GAMM|nr:hypothetical protein [Arenicella chitinivorans]GGZ96862.1 hypothetical protein GCM10008090_01380 [Arenicella chitinivorans]
MKTKFKTCTATSLWFGLGLAMAVLVLKPVSFELYASKWPLSGIQAHLDGVETISVAAPRRALSVFD